MAETLDTRQVEAFRSFNRFYTRNIGVLEEGLLKTPYTLAQARVLFELGMGKEATASDISNTLGLDLGYLSRILQEFASQGLISRKKASDDGRRLLISLTAKGRKAFRALDQKSRDEASAMLAAIPRQRRIRLLTSLQDVQAVLSDPQGDAHGGVQIRPHRIGDFGWAIERHAQIYADEYQWNEEFEALVATLFARFATRHDPAKERFWVAEVAGERVGCVFVVQNQDDPSVAQLRCLLVDPKGRGQGIGTKLVAECVRFAKEAGYREMMLWTNDVLVSARRIYEDVGFVLVKEEQHHSFGHALVGQFWKMSLERTPSRAPRAHESPQPGSN